MLPDSCEGDLSYTYSSTKALQVHQGRKKHLLKFFKGIIGSFPVVKMYKKYRLRDKENLEKEQEYKKDSTYTQ